MKTEFSDLVGDKGNRGEEFTGDLKGFTYRDKNREMLKFVLRDEQVFLCLAERLQYTTERNQNQLITI